ncbi:MAG: phosphoribosylamine--glycine ligase [Acidobacteria bacterium]|nr:phosphoribosylamine--glycine ligase [Acidobacteriota bacterium]
MRVLIVGGGGREHALGWKIAQSPLLSKLYFSPGNPGTEGLGSNVQLMDQAAMVQFAADESIDLVVVGPEKELVDGIADALALKGIPCFGPSKAAAQLEGSKAFSKEVMDRVGVPTAKYGAFTDYDQACKFLEKMGLPVVIKADGLASGKGVTICQTRDQGKAALKEAMLDQRFGSAGNMVVIEEFLTGTEASFHVITDGERLLRLPTAQDHKALGEGNTGPNTGGMGTCSPNPVWTERMSDEVMESVAGPIIDYMRDQGMPFRGVLFIGLMLTWHGPKVLEFNVRFGDPETQVMMPRIKTDLLPVLFQSARGRLEVQDLEIDPQHAVCVVLSAAGYPDSPRKGDVITGIPESGPDQVVFHAGTAHGRDHEVITSGGRVMGATAWAGNLETARKRAYKVANQVQFEGKYMRKDIGLK